jgi:hypothetical protein
MLGRTNFKKHLLAITAALAVVLGQQPLVASAAVPVCSSPSITGTSGVGNTLSVNASCSNSPTSISYQWLKSASSAGTYAPISGATTNSFVVSSAEAGMFIKVSISATNADGTSATVTSSSANGPHVFRATPFVGSATAGNADGLGAAAQFTNIAGITSDSNYLYVADYSAGLIRRVDAAGNVTTIAGSTASTIVDGVGTAASFHSPNAIAYNAAQHSLFIKDASVIREMDLTTGQVTTLQNRQEIYSVSRSGTTVTVTFAQPHGLGSTVTLAGLGAPYDGTFTGVFTASATTITFYLSNFLNVPVFYPTGATATSDLGESRTSANTWWSYYEAFDMAPDGRLYMGRSNSGSSYNTQRLLRFTRISGSVFKYERLASISGTPCALGIVSDTEMYIATCGNISKYSTTDDWATVIPGPTIASSQNAGLVYDHGGYLNYTSYQYDVGTGLTSTKFQGTVTALEIWEIFGTDIYVANAVGQSSTQIFKYTGAASGVRMASTYVPSVSVPNYSVTFDANGGSGTMSAQSASAQTTLTANAFTNSTNTFDGWNTAANGSGTSYADQASYSFSANLVLYAQWTAPSVTPPQTPNPPVNNQSSANPAPSASNAVDPLREIPMVSAWSKSQGSQGSKILVSITGKYLHLVQAIEADPGLARITAKSFDALEVEVASEATGFGSLVLISASQRLIVQDAFLVIEQDVAATAKPLERVVKVFFGGDSARLSSSANQKIRNSLSSIDGPLSIVIEGSVSAVKFSTQNKALALRRAKAAAAEVARVLPGVKITLKIKIPTAVGASERRADIRVVTQN